MNVFVHKKTKFDINIFDWTDDNELRCEFFKDKSACSDLLMSHTRGDVNFLYLFRITEILENRDSNTLSPFDGIGAYFRLKVEMLNDPKTFKLPEGFEHINCSRRDNC